MIAAVSLMRRSDGVSLDQFNRHWLTVHGPLVCAFAGLRAYAQYHVIGANAAGLAMRIDGFPILFFDNDSDRMLAHGSSEMAACDIDSRQFIGAVSRVITDVEVVVPRAARSGGVPLIALYQEASAIGPHLDTLRAASGLTQYHVREQGGAPNSTVPRLPVIVGRIAQAWFDDEAARAAAMARCDGPYVALFAAREYWLV